MFSIGKCSARSGSDESVAGGISKVSVPSDEVASAVAAVSDEIGDILKDELGDADRADRIGAELADLSAELGLLAGLADEPQQDFPSLFEIAIGHRASGSGSSSSSWSGGRGGRSRRPPRPQRAPRRRPIAKGKEMSRRRSAVARRAASVRVRCVEVVSDASDVGADSDSDDQWTELDDNSGSTDSSSGKEVSGLEIDCPPYQHKGSQVEPPPMGQFLLPLLSADPTAPDPEHFLIRHEDILQLLASAEDSVRDEQPLEDNAGLNSAPDVLSNELYEYEDPVVTPEEEAALLHYVCAEPPGGQAEAPFAPVEEWLLGVYHSWCEISALMYTLIGTNMSAEMVKSEWSYRARFGCHCRLCLSLANNSSALHRFLAALIADLAHGGNTASIGAKIVQALQLVPGRQSRPDDWDIASLQRLKVCDDGASIIHDHLSKLSRENETTNEIVNSICLCRAYDRPFEKLYAMERFCKLIENFKAASTITFKVEMVPGAAPPAAPACGGTPWWGTRLRSRLARRLAPQSRCSTSERLAHMAARTAPHDLSAWSGYKHRCDCLTPRTLCAQQRKQLLRISFFGIMQAVNEFNGTKEAAEEPSIDMKPDNAGRELQQGDGTGAKPPDNFELRPSLTKSNSTADLSDSNATADLDDLTDSDANSGTASLGLSTSSSLDSASELLLAAAAAVESGGSSGEGGGQLCRTVRQLMKSIASIERLMDRVLQHCDQWTDHEARKRVHVGLSEVDRKLMAMYRRLPDVHRRQLQLYRKQKRLSTVCTQLVGGRAPAPPPPGSPPPAPAHTPCRPLCPEYHLQRFKEVRRKVMHMRDQQLYYHRLRMWLEDQLRQERESLPESNVTLIEDLPRRKRRTASPKNTKISTAPKRKLKPANISQTISKPHKILQMLRHKAPAQNDINIKSPYKEIDDEPSVKSEAEPPEAFPLEKEDNVSDAETIVGEKETGDICKEMRECLAKFANFALNSPDNNLKEDYDVSTEFVKYPESVSPPLQEMSPTTSEPIPVYTQNPRRILAVNKIFNKDDKVIDFQSQVTPEVNAPLSNREFKEVIEVKEVENSEEKDADVYKYVTFGLKIKKAMEECQNIINSYNSVSKSEKEKQDIDEPPSLEQIIEVMMTLDKNSAEFLEKMDSDDPVDMNIAINKLSELVENMPQTLANMPEIASKLSEFANASFELPEFASIMNSLPDVNNEAQLTPETLKQIRELKLSKRDSVKVTKNTAKRKINRRIKNNDNELATFEFDGKDLSELLRDEKELQNLMKNKNNKEDFKDLLFSISAQVVINKVFEYVKQNKSPELAKCLEEEKELFSLPHNSINSEMYSKASTLFDNSVKDAMSMDELRELVQSRFNSWKHYVATKFKGIPIELLDNEIEAMLDKFYSYIQDLASKQCSNESDKIIEKIDELRKNNDNSRDSDSEGCPASKETLKQITKLLSTFAGNTLDLLIMKLSKLSEDKKSAVKSLKFKYMDVIRRCTESQQLAGWIMLDPEIATNVIQELTGLEVRKVDNAPDFSTAPADRKKDYFINRLREMNRQYMETLPKKGLTGDEWLVMLYRLEQLEEKLKDAFSKVTPAPKLVQTQNASEAEILAAKGLSKIIGKANVRIVKKTNQEPPKPKKEPEVETQPTNDKDDKKAKNDALLAKCEAILTSRGEKSLLDSFYTIKSYITQGLQVPETYRKHVISVCSSIDAKLLDDDIEETLKLKSDEQETLDVDNNKAPLSVIGSQNPELLAKYSAQALRNAKQTLNAVAFRNMTRNGQTKSESDVCDTPKTNCKWTNDCVCDSCKDSDVSSVCLGDIVKQCYDDKSKNGLEEKKKEVKKAPPKQKPAPKPCENANHQQHVCKVAHGGVCSGEGATDQPCNCCYCTVFGHAPPLTTPVPRNFNETRERLRSILNKKKQKCKTTNGEAESPVERSPPQPQAPVPPALPKTLPPNLTTQAQQKRQAMENQQKQLADKMAKMVVSEKPEVKPKTTQVPTPAQTKVLTITAEGIVNANAMEQIRLQQLKQQQQAQLQQQLQQQQQQAQQQQTQQQQTQQQPAQQQPTQQQQSQKKPEPIYDLPIHNKPTLTPQQQQQIRLQQQQHHDEMVRQNHLHLQQQIQLQKQLQLHEVHQRLQHQHLDQQIRQSRQQQNAVSLSSRDTSVFSFSSGCSGGSCWRGRGGCNNRAEDPRDLDALLQYIEGPARHVDRGKKRAKKMRQKAKRMESRLCDQLEELQNELSAAQTTVSALKKAHSAASRDLELARHTLAAQRTKKKGKKQKLNPAQQAKVQLVAEQLGDCTSLVNTTAKELQTAERRVSECSRRLRECERELCEARTLQGKPDAPDDDHELQHQLQMQREAILKQHYEQQRFYELDQTTQMMMDGFGSGETVRVAHADGSAVTLSLRGQPDPALARLIAGTEFKVEVCEDQSSQKQIESQKKQTWEQAIAHMNQLAKGSAKEKKKQKESQSQKNEAKKEKESTQAALEAQSLSKKQKKLLAKQQVEEEERRKEQQQQEAKSKKDKKIEPLQTENTKKEKKEQKKEEAKKKKEEKKEAKKEEKKGKENKVDKIVTTAKTKTTQQQQQSQQQSQQNNKKDKKKDSQKPQVINITPDTTIEVVSKKSPCANEPEKPASCSIMEQLSCGVQVSDLKLPPGITLTRVQPSEKKETPVIKSVPLWKHNQLESAPTPVPRPPPVINADPSLMMFSTHTHGENPKTIIIPEPQQPQQPTGKSKKAKKKAKKAAETEQKQEGAKMVTLRNPMFHPNLPPVQITNAPPQKKSEIRIPDPIPMPPTPCQATITPTSNGMYTIRNPLMSMMHQQNLMGIRSQNPQMNPMYNQPQYNYVNPNVYNPQYAVDPSQNPAKNPDNEFQNRIMNLASFTQKNDEGYSLFKTPEETNQQQKSFLTPEFYDDQNPKVVSPNPIGTRPDHNRNYENDSLFANPVRPEPIGTPLKIEEERLYTPFGQENRNVFHNALFNDKPETSLNLGKMEDNPNYMPNGDQLPYFQRLRAGSKLNSEVTIHYVTDSKFYKGQEGQQCGDSSLFSRPHAASWPDTHNNSMQSSVSSMTCESACESGGTSPPQQQQQQRPESSVFLPDRSITNLSSLEVSEREIESFKRFDFYFEPPQHKPKVQLDVRDIAAALRQNQK